MIVVPIHVVGDPVATKGSFGAELNLRAAIND